MKAFISYSHKDGRILDRLHVHLKTLVREGVIKGWFDREILAGSEIDTEVKAQLLQSDLFLLIVSPDFLASNYCYDIELTTAMEKHENGTARVVPIIVEDCEWKNTPLGKLKAIPKDGKAISTWTNENTALLDVTSELRRVGEQFSNFSHASEKSDVQISETSVSLDEKRYRVRKSFDEIDISEFRETAFDEIRLYFKSAIDEIDGVEGLRGRYYSLGETSFGATIVNKLDQNRSSHITFHFRTNFTGFGDINYVFQERADSGTSNGGFLVQHNEYDLFLRLQTFSKTGANNETMLAPKAAAESVWVEFLGHAGVVYD